MDAEVDLSVVVVYYEIARKSKLLGRGYRGRRRSEGVGARHELQGERLSEPGCRLAGWTAFVL